MKRTTLVALSLLASLFLHPLHAQTPTRFVNGADGTCDGNGPCHTTIQDAVDAAAAGEVIEVQTSSEYQENVIVISISDLTILNRPGDAPQISPLAGHGLVLRASPHFTLDGVDIDLKGRVGTLDGLPILQGAEPLDGLVVRNLRIRGTKDCVDFEASVDGVTFDNVEFFNATDDMGVEVNAAEFGDTIHNLTISNCRFTGNKKHLWLSGDVRNVVIDNNFFDRTLSGEAIIIEDLTTTAGPIDITNNVIIDSQQQGLLVRSGTNSHVNVIGNTIVNLSTFNGDIDDNVGVTFRDLGNGNIIRDNIVVSNGVAAGYAKSDSQNVTFDHNLQFNVGSGTESSAESPISLDATSVEANPAFMDDSTLADDFRLGCASPAIGASSTGGNMGAEQSAPADACALCATDGQIGDGDLDGVDGCVDECPSTPVDTCVDAVGCRVRTVLFDFGATWDYDDTGTDVSGTFRTTPLSSSGPAQLGFGDGDEATTLTNQGTLTYYFNKEFALGDPLTIGSLTLDIAYDDGYIAYVNQVEVGRSDNMVGVTGDFSSPALFSGENWLDRGIVISASVLVAGTNLMAVEIHQDSATSSDISFDARLQESSFCMSAVDGDGDSFPVGSDCDDGDPNNWIRCDTCSDDDGDGYYIGCDAYATISGPDNCPGQYNPDEANQDGDGLGDSCDCAPQDPTNASPLKLGDTVRVGKTGTDAELNWDGETLPGPFRLYRGYRHAFTPFEYNHVCLGVPIASTSTVDPDVGPTYRLLYYLVNREGCGESGLGMDSAGTERPNDDPCPSVNVDTDGDTIVDALDNCPDDINLVQDDTDEDGVGDVCDNCPFALNPSQVDSDDDGDGDACDDDRDEDGIDNDDDNCPDDPNTDQNDGDTDGVGDVCDNCPDDFNPGQENGDEDDLGDACDPDRDGDGEDNGEDNCPDDFNPGQENQDGDTLGDACDTCPNDFDNDVDSDGVCGDVDNCPDDPNAGQANRDGDTLGDVCDPCPGNPDELCVACPAGTDPDGDGFCDAVDIKAATQMKYLANTSDPGIGLTWIAPGFPDAAWTLGVYGIGYDTSGAAANLLDTVVPLGTSSVYTRVEVTLATATEMKHVAVGADYDDAYAVWVNGELAFVSTELPDATPDWSESPTQHESSNGAVPNYGLPNNATPDILPFLVDGPNVVAVGVWNSSPNSPDLVLVPRVVISADNCPSIANPDQADGDGDGFGDACDE